LHSSVTTHPIVGRGLSIGAAAHLSETLHHLWAVGCHRRGIVILA
jgi:hypothetical protein